MLLYLLSYILNKLVWIAVVSDIALFQKNMLIHKTDKTFGATERMVYNSYINIGIYNSYIKTDECLTKLCNVQVV